jgi:hypothetical protein
MAHCTTQSSGPRSRAGGRFSRALRASVALLLLLPQLTGCFHYVPASPAALPSGTEVSVGITDRGRVALTETVGPGVRRIGGNLVETTDTTLALAVSTVEYFDLAFPARWAGERVEIPRDLISDVQERRLSRSRTALMTAVIVVAAIGVTFLGITGFGGDVSGGEGGDPDQQ